MRVLSSCLRCPPSTNRYDGRPQWPARPTERPIVGNKWRQESSHEEQMLASLAEVERLRTNSACGGALNSALSAPPLLSPSGRRERVLRPSQRVGQMGKVECQPIELDRALWPLACGGVHQASPAYEWKVVCRRFRRCDASR